MLEWSHGYSAGCVHACKDMCFKCSKSSLSICSSKILTLSITFQPDENYLIKTGEEKSLDWEVKVAHLGNSDFRVEVDGVSRDVCLAVYSKAGHFEYHNIEISRTDAIQFGKVLQSKAE
ncbi:hypothetical protein CK203_046488 [Vitis vinifera]|uniref:Methylcrotonoyl-CoA carboxylase subunit alpha BT domain-containing protein n=1 Tax=Vitis vinifera TaxID=29760 RepID=A0A438ILK9_VITVI|nr:hypothetical protein CK203_046488 [Vitis vinifera]